ncbi:MAG: PAS domain-containing protein, partial [Alteripontixanthobacter sp.]
MTVSSQGKRELAYPETATLLCERKWEDTALGPREAWPTALETLIDVMIGSGQPMFVVWGKERTLIYNDPYAEILANKHPEAFGADFLEVWNEISEELLPIVEQAMNGIPVQSDDIELWMERKGYTEETHFAFSYTPVRSDDSEIAGFFCVCQETTGQILAERALRASEAEARANAERVQLALDAGAIIGTWFWDIKNDRLDVDEAFAVTFGMPPELSRDGLRLDQVTGAVHPDDRDSLEKAIETSIAKGGAYAHQYRVKRADERYYWVEANGRVDIDETGTATTFSGVLLDIEERRETERALKDVTRRLEAILDNTREAVFLMNEDQHCVYANRSAELLTGYRLDEMRGRPLHDVVHHKKPDGSHYPIEECPIDRAFPARAQMSGEELFVAPDGSFYPVTFTASPMLDDRGKPVGTVIEARNISEEKAAEAEQQVTQERYRLAVKATNDAIWDWDLTANKVQWNEAIETLFGYGKDDVDPTGDWWIEHIHPDDRARIDESIHAVIDGQESHWTDEYRFMDVNGDPIHVYDRGFVIRNDEGKAVRMIGAMLDLTERRRAEEALQELNHELERRVTEEVEERAKAEEALRQAQKMEAVGQLTGGIAHDFNNLLTIVTGNIDMADRALRRSSDPDPRLQRALGSALKGAERAAALTQRLLAFSRRQPLEPKPIDADRLVSGMSDLVQRALGETIKLEVVTSPGLWRAEADPHQLEAAILNLSVNSRDAMPQGGTLTIETANARLDEAYSAEHAEVAPGQYVVIAVTDTGHGMSKETLTRVFEPFFTTKDVGKGTGLGLSMVYGFTKQSGGHVKIYSEEGHGTTIKIYLPRLVNDVAEEA